MLIAMLRRPEGATIAQVIEATGWQPHTVRGAISGALKKKRGLEVTSDEERGRRAGLPDRCRLSLQSSLTSAAGSAPAASHSSRGTPELGGQQRRLSSQPC